jgi:hypothetical protein
VLPFVTWLVQGAAGPALFGLPVTWAGTRVAQAAGKWFRRMRDSDGVSRIVKAAVGVDVGLSSAEFTAIRHLLEEESTWLEVGRGTVEDLAALIASRLTGRPADSALAAGRAIAAGLLEFAVYDLEPELFGKVLFARLDRIQTDQASALDQAMLGLHADLAVQFAAQDAANSVRFAQLIGQLGLVLDRLPPGSADETTVKIYLATLIKWMDTDPWLQDSRPEGSALTPAAIERKLTIVAGPGSEEQDLDADGLASKCARLVVLGGPGSGKTWLARRTARLCAEEALEDLAAGASIDEVELPLYTTCARLLAEPLGDGIRHAVVASALGLLPDIGGSRIFRALRKLFEDRTAQTLLVADSLDEARAADDRIRQADWLPDRWRIVLTTRPGSWNRQLGVGGQDKSRRLGNLRPLQYPGDVEAFIGAWFAGRPEAAEDLATALRHRPDLQQAATVPLILAFFCILARDGPLPARRADLYEKVIKRLLIGRWRGSGEPDLDVDACVETLRGWAWSAAASNPLSGVGEWLDEFTTPRVTLGADERAALDRVATPLAHADTDTGMTRRRFVHRSVQEYLVADAVARMPAREAAEELLKHLWYDPDWEYAAPAALALHPDRGEVLKELTCRITRGDQFPADLAAVDQCWEIRRLLARAAQESDETDWPREAAALIAGARMDLAMSREPDLGEDLRLVVAVGWPTSNRAILGQLLRRVAENAEPWFSEAPDVIARLAVSEEDRVRARHVLLDALAREFPYRMVILGQAVARLNPPAADRAQARQVLFRALAADPDTTNGGGLAEAISRLDPPEQERGRVWQILLDVLANGDGRLVGDALVRLAVTEQEKQRLRDALLNLLADQAHPALAIYSVAQILAGLSPGADELGRARDALLARLTAGVDPESARAVVHTIAKLAVTVEEQAQARAALLARLDAEPGPELVEVIADGIARLDPSAHDEATVRQTLLSVGGGRSVKNARELAGAVGPVDPSADLAQIAQVLLAVLYGPDDRVVAIADKSVIAERLDQLDLTAADRARARQALLSLLAERDDTWEAAAVAMAVAGLDPTQEGQAGARQALLTLLTSRAAQIRSKFEGVELSGLAGTVALLNPTEDDLARARQELFGVLAASDETYTAAVVASRIARLHPAPEDRTRARETLLTLLASQTRLPLGLGRLMGAIDLLQPTWEDRARARQALLGILAEESDPASASQLTYWIAQHEPTPAERASCVEALLVLLTDESDPDDAWWIADGIATLGLTAEARTRALRVLRELLSREISMNSAVSLTEAFERLEPSVADLTDSDRWPLPLSREVMLTARRNSTCTAWLEALPWLTLAITYKDWRK